MKFGRDKERIHKNNVLSVPTGVSGIGEERHPFSNELISNPHEQRIVDLVLGNVEVIETNEPKPSKLKLYLSPIKLKQHIKIVH